MTERNSLIEQVVWLVARLDRRALLAVLSYANRLFCDGRTVDLPEPDIVQTD